MIPAQRVRFRRTWQSRRDDGLRAPALSLARPGGIITGSSSQGTDYGGEQIELFGQIDARLHCIEVIANNPGALGKILGLTTPEPLLLRADQVIERCRLLAPLRHADGR
jgi:hypothetical protein